MNKRGGLNISINTVIILIIALVAILLLVNFINSSFGGTNKKIQELILKENEPPSPSSESPITLSRENIITKSRETEVIKIAVLNPTPNDWMQRDTLYQESYGCNAADGVCYVTDSCGENDVDCEGETDRECNSPDKAPDGVCLVNPVTCPEGEEGGPESDCGPHAGIDLLIRCDNELQISKLSEPKEIPSGDIMTFTSILSVKRGIKGTYLCKIEVLGHDDTGNLIQNIQKDLIIEVV